MTRCLQIEYAMCNKKGMIKYSEIRIDVLRKSLEFLFKC